jgi:hypothetical protein
MGREWGYGGLRHSVFRDKLMKLGSSVVRHARAITFQLAEVAITGPMARATFLAAEVLASSVHRNILCPAGSGCCT